MVEVVNYDTDIEASVNVNTLAGSDNVYVDDTIQQMIINTGDDSDTVQVGQLFSTVLSGLATVATPYGKLSAGVSHDSTINLGSGDDSVRIYRNTAPLSIYGNSGSDQVTVQPFINAGNYVLNETLTFSGNAESDTLTVKGTSLVDNVMIESAQIKGMGQTIHYTETETINLDTGNNDDNIYVVSTLAGTQTNVISGSGNDIISVAGNVSEPVVTLTSTQKYSSVHDLNEIAGAVDLNAGDSATFTLESATILPTESNVAGTLTVSADASGNQEDELYFFNDANSTDQSGTLTATSLTGLGMAGGVDYTGFEIVDLLLGTADETLTVEGNAPAAITLIHGGGGADTITVLSVAAPVHLW